MNKIALAIGLSGSLIGCSHMRRPELPVEILQVVCEKAQSVCDNALELQKQPRIFSWPVHPNTTECRESPAGTIILSLTGQIQKSCEVIFHELALPTVTISAPTSPLSQY